jgi:hypothetical protein
VTTRYVVTPKVRMSFDNRKAFQTVLALISAYRPNYVIQGDRHLVYLNPAFGSWLARLGPTPTHLPVRRLTTYIGMGRGSLLDGSVDAWLGLTVLSPIRRSEATTGS